MDIKDIEPILICGWITDDVTFSNWIQSKKIDIESYLKEPDSCKTIPKCIKIIPVYDKGEPKWGIHIRFIDGSFSSIKNIPSFLLYQVKEFYTIVTKNIEEPRCHVVLFRSID